MNHADERLYVVSRADLDVGFAAAQCVHAAFLFARDHWEETAPWMRDSQWLVLVTVPDEADLVALAWRAGVEHITYSAWHEPDRDDELTAVALAPSRESRVLTANLPRLGKMRMGTGTPPPTELTVELTENMSPRDRTDLVRLGLSP